MHGAEAGTLLFHETLFFLLTGICGRPGQRWPARPASGLPAGMGHEAQKCETFVKIKPNLHGAEAGPSIVQKTLYFTVICARPGRRWPARPASGLPAGRGMRPTSV